MPQATEELRERMRLRFGDPIDDSGPIKFLTDAGYREAGGGTWHPKSGVTTHADMTPDEWEAMLFLIQEWDWGGLVAIEEGASP